MSKAMYPRRCDDVSNRSLCVGLLLVLITLLFYLSSLVGTAFLNLGAVALIKSTKKSHYIIANSDRQLKIDGAVRYLTEAERKAPRSSRVHRLLGVIAILRGDVQNAVQHYAYTTETTVYDPVLIGEQGLVLDMAGMNEKAIDHWRSNGSAKWLIALANGYEALDRLSESAEYYSLAARIAPNDDQVLEATANFFYRHRMKERAAETYTRLAALETSKRAYALFMLGRIAYERERDIDLSTKYFSQAVKADPSFLEVYRYAGIYLRYSGRYAESSEWFARVRALSPNLEDADFFMGLNAYDRGLFEQAVRYLRAATRKGGQNPEEYYYLGQSYYKLKEFPDAVENLEIAVSLWEKSSSQSGESKYLRTLGDVYQAIGDTGKAIDAYNRAITIDPQDIHTREQLHLLGVH